MKKVLIPLAVMTAAGAASAQSSVTLFGIIDTTVEHGSASGPGSTRITQLTNSGYNSSRIGVRGREDLGGGLAASFWLEGSLGTDDGRAGGAIPAGNQAVTAQAGSGLNFNRRSTLSLEGDWGEVRAGRDYTAPFLGLLKYDPFLTNGVGTSLGFAGAAANGLAPSGTAGVLGRASNSVGYFLPSNLRGFYGQAQYFLGENVQNGATTEHDGNGFGVRGGYAMGPLDVSASYGRTKFAQTAGTGDFKTWNVGGQWDFGVVQVMAEYGRDRRDSLAAVEGTQWLVGANVPVGPGTIRTSYSTYKADMNTPGLANPRAGKLALGYVYNLSKRTAIYTTVARVKNQDGSAIALGGATIGAGVGNASSTGFDVGVRHSF
ncbi:porin [Ramlibacter sp.]|uniref:porin n=1 Tax=Ramlibacter sp. TaxID=1917967 RepID=UPI0026141B24|nr:porin [Ramlibacter sp.]MDB5955853.1 putative outer rane porin protein precursor [Ramlibacter sp.]